MAVVEKRPGYLYKDHNFELWPTIPGTYSNTYETIMASIDKMPLTNFERVNFQMNLVFALSRIPEKASKDDPNSPWFGSES